MIGLLVDRAITVALELLLTPRLATSEVGIVNLVSDILTVALAIVAGERYRNRLSVPLFLVIIKSFRPTLGLLYDLVAGRVFLHSVSKIAHQLLVSRTLRI